jgi:hypothetical protein
MTETNVHQLLGPMPIIVSVAMKVNGLVVSMPRPARHCDIIKRLPGKLANVRPSDQGFLTDAGNFVGREVALRLARQANQLMKPTTKSELYSEDVW